MDQEQSEYGGNNMPIWKRLLLSLYYCGSCPLRCWSHRCAVAEGRVPVMVLFYHRIADDRASAWTVSNRTFARQISWLSGHFRLVSLDEAQRRIHSGVNNEPCVSVTFDDGYADNCHQAIPLLIKQCIPCTYFVTVQNVLDARPFPHDLARGKPSPPNTLGQLRAMAAAGIEIGAHTYTHPDLAAVTDRRRLHYEVVTAGEDLQQALGRPVRYFAFPFGRHVNLTREAFELAYEAGYEAACSAYGGFNFPGEDAFHLQRIPVDDDMISMKNWTTVDPRKLRIPRYAYEPPSGRRPPRGERMKAGG
jgi:peptidoglycan/xylan/chitin deacetylase (PgdA/CDA1 family)